jgi:hypothetical protein
MPEPRNDRQEHLRQAVEGDPLYQRLIEHGADAAALMRLAYAAHAWRPEPLERATETWEETGKRLTDPERVCEFIPTGIPPLDTFLDGGLQPGTVTALVGGEAVGKSTLSKNMGHNSARAGICTGAITLEGGVDGFRMPLIALESGIHFSKIRSWWYAQSRPTERSEGSPGRHRTDRGPTAGPQHDGEHHRQDRGVS